MFIIKRLHFTLLEILVVIFLLTTVAGFIGIHIKGAYEEQQFMTETESMIDHLQLAQDLMLILDTDVYFHIVQEADHQLSYYLDVNQPLVVKREPNFNLESPLFDSMASKKWAAFVQRHIPLRTVQAVDFKPAKGLTTPFEKNDETKDLLVLRFSAGAIHQGELSLKGPKDQRRMIILPGYPTFLHRQESLVKEWVDGNEDRLRQQSQDLYPQL
jgi:hypothetical protein